MLQRYVLVALVDDSVKAAIDMFWLLCGRAEWPASLFMLARTQFLRIPFWGGRGMALFHFKVVEVLVSFLPRCREGDCPAGHPHDSLPSVATVADGRLRCCRYDRTELKGRVRRNGH